MNVTSHVCIGGGGGTRVNQEIKIFSDGVQVVIGTTGRVLDLIKRRSFGTTNIKHVIVGNAVELLTGGVAYQTKMVHA